MKKAILIIAFIAWGWACFLGGYLICVNCGTLFPKKNIVETVSIAGAGSDNNVQMWEGK